MVKVFHVQKKVQLASWLYDYTGLQGLVSGFSHIDVVGLDPRLVFVPRLWITRESEWQSPVDQAAKVRWSAYAAGEACHGDLLTLRLVENCQSREIRPVGASIFAAEGIYCQGDALEFRTGHALRLAVELQSDRGGVLGWLKQVLWFAADVFPANPDMQDKEWQDLLEEVEVDVSPPVVINSTGAPG